MMSTNIRNYVKCFWHKKIKVFPLVYYLTHLFQANFLKLMEKYSLILMFSFNLKFMSKLMENFYCQRSNNAFPFHTNSFIINRKKLHRGSIYSICLCPWSCWCLPFDPIGTINPSENKGLLITLIRIFRTLCKSCLSIKVSENLITRY